MRKRLREAIHGLRHPMDALNLKVACVSEV
jgi:hypothetical protein